MAKMKIRVHETKKQEALEDYSEEVQQMVQELAEETGNDLGSVELDGSAPGQGLHVRFGDAEYYCYARHIDAELASSAGVKKILKDLGLEGLDMDIEPFVDVGWFDDKKRDYAEFYVHNIKVSDPQRYKKEFGDLDEEEAMDKYLEDEEDDSILWYINNYGQKDFYKLIKAQGLVDMDALADAITEADGPANELARYDGVEIELPCGYYCYRVE